MSEPKEVHVKVVLHPGATNGDFHFETIGLPMGDRNHLYFENVGFPGFSIHYDLDGEEDYVFPDEDMTKFYLDEALYSKNQPGCPTTKGQWGQFKAIEVRNAGRTLVVRNRNQTPQAFGYTLRVTKDDGHNYLDLDPGATNQNGPQQMSKVSPLAAGLAGAVAGAVLTLGAQALFNP
jgi:hypothetical protein